MKLRSCLSLALLAATALSQPSAVWEPYPYLNGVECGSGNGTSPDPTYGCVWQAGVNASQLQVFYLYPVAVAACEAGGGIVPTPITNADAHTHKEVPSSGFRHAASVRVAAPSGNGSITTPFACARFDFGVETPAWLEVVFSSAAAADATRLLLAVSEYDEWGRYNNDYFKYGPANVSVLPDGSVLARLTLRSDPTTWYEGVRFGWLFFNSSSPPSAPMLISTIRLAVQVRPTNYGGSFSMSGDPISTSVWHMSAYTVKANLQAGFFGTILVYRGDRFSWTGDAHVAQATAMVSFGDWSFIAGNIDLTSAQTNGIESYALYWVLSVMEYYRYTGDAALLQAYVVDIAGKLAHANSIWYKTAGLGFEGWDDRLGSGFRNATCLPAQLDYRMIAIRAFNESAVAMTAIGNDGLASVFAGYAAAAIAATRAPGPAWYEQYGIFAAADAICAGFLTEQEQLALLSLRFNDTVTICGLSPFNTYWILQAMALLGELDRGLAIVHRCWGEMLTLGATTTWEVFVPDWTAFLGTNDAIPGFEDGYTSMAHPWSTGAAPWLSRNILGIQPTSPGYLTVRVAPHVSASAPGVDGSVPTPHGPISVTAQQSTVEVVLPGGVLTAELELSSTLLDRISGLQCAADGWSARLLVNGVHTAQVALSLVPSSRAPRVTSGGARALSAIIHVTPGARTRLELVCAKQLRSHSLPQEPPFPTPVYPVTFLGADAATAGSWISSYGSAGFIMFGYDSGADRMQLPPFVDTVINTFSAAQTGSWLTGTSDARALQNPSNPSGPRALGFRAMPVDDNPSFAIDIAVTRPGNASAQWAYRLSAYLVDFVPSSAPISVANASTIFNYPPGVLDPARRQTLTILDGVTWEPVSIRQLARNFTSGVWYSWQCSSSVRMRIDLIRGPNQVISALMFDVLHERSPLSRAE